MTPSPKGTKAVGLKNEKQILSILKQKGEINQTQLRKLTGFSPSTASYIIARLRDKGLITETIGNTGKRGAKPVIISINEMGAFAVGAEITPAEILLGLHKINAALVESIKIPLSGNHTPQIVCQHLEFNIRGLFEKHKISENNLLGIGIALSGSITPSGQVQLSSPMGWKNVALKEMLSKSLPFPIEIFTTKVRLLAELAIDPELNTKDVVYINVSNGVGANVILDGRAVKGFTNRSCEIGHIVIDSNGPVCGCGNKGCLEALISTTAISKKIIQDVANGVSTSINQSVIYDTFPEHTLNRWAEAVEKGDAYALEVLNFVADKIAKAAAIIINCYDPQYLILAGDVIRKCPEYFIKAVLSRFSTDVYDNKSRSIIVRAAKAGKKALMLGSAMAIIQNSLDPNVG